MSELQHTIDEQQAVIHGTIEWLLRDHGFTGELQPMQVILEWLLKTLKPGEDTYNLLEDIQAVWDIQQNLVQRFGIDKAREIIEAGYTELMIVPDVDMVEDASHS